MHGRKFEREKIYPTYKPYPFSLDFPVNDYSGETSHGFDKTPANRNENQSLEGFPDLAGDISLPEWFQSKPIPSNDEGNFRPLRLLNSLFSDRLNFLQRALEELEASKQERAELTRNALDDLDSDIEECERYLSIIQGAINDPELRRHLERRLFDLKRERRSESLLSWRDIVLLKGEIRKLKREVEAQETTAGSNENRDAPT